ncbi:MAG: Ku protein [Acidobacteria bacterium RIFCSPLOWO2_12_FULL_66_10]|nr:MAG: Ku protein [Acidobacteria bacterium RIFCSPLOWO2_12_FULL_66_10]
MRATWKGFLKISLVNIPIKVFPATESSATISLNQLHEACQTRIQQKRWCAHCNREVPNSEIVKGYEFEKGRYVVLSDEDFDNVRPASTRVIDLVQFADDSSIDPMYVDRTYYLAPDGGMAADAFAVMRDGMKGKVGVGKLALYGREYLVAVRPHERGIVMHTLHHAAEIRSADAVEELNVLPLQVKPNEIKLAKQVIEMFEAPLNLRDYRDEYREGLQRIIDANIAGEEIVAPAVEAAPKVVNLMEALRKSLDSVSAKQKTPAKAVVAKSAARRKRA